MVPLGPESTDATKGLNNKEVFLELSTLHSTTHLLAEVLVHLGMQRLNIPAAGENPSLSIDNKEICIGPALGSASPSAIGQSVPLDAASAWQTGRRTA